VAVERVLGRGPVRRARHEAGAPISGALGRLTLTLGRPDEAENHYRDAVALCERMDARAFLAVACRELGSLLLSAEDCRVVTRRERCSPD